MEVRRVTSIAQSEVLSTGESQFSVVLRPLAFCATVKASTQSLAGFSQTITVQFDEREFAGIAGA